MENTFLNPFKDVIYLFDMELHKPIIFTSKKDSEYKAHMMLNQQVDRNNYTKVIGYKIEVILTGPNLFEKDEFSPTHMDSKYVFDFLKWFHDNPKQMHQTLYHDFFTKIMQENG